MNRFFKSKLGKILRGILYIPIGTIPLRSTESIINIIIKLIYENTNITIFYFLAAPIWFLLINISTYIVMKITVATITISPFKTKGTIIFLVYFVLNDITFIALECLKKPEIIFIILSIITSVTINLIIIKTALFFNYTKKN